MSASTLSAHAAGTTSDVIAGASCGSSCGSATLTFSVESMGAPRSVKCSARLQSPTGFDQSKAVAWRGWGRQQRPPCGTRMSKARQRVEPDFRFGGFQNKAYHDGGAAPAASFRTSGENDMISEM